MSFVRWLAACSVAVGAAGCASRPVPDDVTGYNTYQIVSRIRCEMRDAIRDRVTNAIRVRAGRVDNLTAQKYLAIAEGLENKTLPWSNLYVYLKQLDRDLNAVVQTYHLSAIAYEFKFDMTEQNTSSASLNFLGAVTRGTINVSASAGNDLTRHNTRSFTVTDNFENLVTLVPEYYCDPNGPAGTIHVRRHSQDLVYPITGSLKLDELVRSFLDLNQSGNLGGPTDPKSHVTVPTITDEIQFTTTITGGVNPSLALVPRKSGFELGGATLNTSAHRTDLHSVKIALSLPFDPAAPRPVGLTIAESRALGERGREALKIQAAQRALTQIDVQRDRDLVEATTRWRQLQSRNLELLRLGVQ